MNSAAIVTLALVAVLVLALAAYLATIAYTLNKVSFHLGTILIGVRSIANQTAPVGEIVESIAKDVTAIDDALKDLLTPAPPARAAVGRGSRAR